MAHDAPSDGSELISIKKHKRRGIYRHHMHIKLVGSNFKIDNSDNSILEIILFDQG